jgi:uncharacterized membrane protein
MITTTPFWFVETDIYNINFDFNGIIFGAIMFIVWAIIVLPFLIIAFEIYCDDN